MRKVNLILFIIIISTPVISHLSCTGVKSDTVQEEHIQSISSIDQFNAIIEHSGNRLIAFNLYADWCMPCHVLEPVLNEIAKENTSKISIYKINADQFPQIIEAFGVNGIPFVVFIKNKKAIYALMGVQPKESYLKIINSYADTSSGKIEEPEGKKIEGLKIKLKPSDTNKHSLLRCYQKAVLKKINPSHKERN